MSVMNWGQVKYTSVIHSLGISTTTSSLSSLSSNAEFWNKSSFLNAGETLIIMRILMLENAVQKLEILHHFEAIVLFCNFENNVFVFDGKQN